MIDMKQLAYPMSNLSRKRRALKRSLEEGESLVERRIAILGGSTSAEIKNILELFLLKNGIKPIFYESEYQKYYEDAIYGNEVLDLFSPDVIYIHTSHVNITQYPKTQDSSEEVQRLLEQEMEKYKSMWRALARFNCAIIQNNFDYPLDRSLGNLDCYDLHGKTHFITQLNQNFAEHAREQPSLYLQDINYLASYMGLRHWFDRSLWYQAKYAMSMDAISELAFNLSHIILALLGKTKKCLVLDLDNTCWGGVIGDDGLAGIQIGQEGAVAESFSALQRYAKELKERGVTLAVCSKNDEQNAIEGFQHPDSILSIEDFTVFKANWEPKHHNIIEIAEEINIGLDSLVFLDDNPVEREIVSSQVAGVSVPDVGSDVLYFIDHLDRNGYFETVSLSADDLKRSQYYKDNQKRAQEEATYQSYGDFLTSLQMQAEINRFTPIYLQRITQLTNKTNQFNLTTQRYTAGEIQKISEDEQYIALYGKLRDKYGDNGLVAITIGRIVDQTCHLDLWLMSCRVLKREMEFAMLDVLVQQCLSKEITHLIGYYSQSAKNGMVAELYQTFGFDLVEAREGMSIWSLCIDGYQYKNSHIEIVASLSSSI